MSNSGELTSRKESIKILRAPGNKNKHHTQRSLIARLFRRRKQQDDVGSIHKNDHQDDRSSSKDVVSSEEIIWEIQREDDTCTSVHKNTLKAPRCKEKKKQQKRIVEDSISSTTRLEELRCKEFVSGIPYLSPRRKKLATDIINQRPKTPYKASIPDRLQDQSLGAYTESNSLDICPAFSISTVGCNESKNDVTLPSTESGSPKTRKGALKETQNPIIEESPVVNYTQGYQPDSDSSSSCESDDSETPPSVRVDIRPAARSMRSICYSMKRPDVTDEDRRRLHAYLNQFSSVHISRNLKDPIPKDPETLPGFHAATSRRRMAEALSRHGSSLYGSSQASTHTQNRNNAKGKKKKKKSWLFPATTGDVTMPEEQTGADSLPNQSQDQSQHGRSTAVKRMKNDSQVSTEVRLHDLTKKPSSSSTKTLETCDKTDENATSGSVSRIGKHRPQSDATPPVVDRKKSHRSIHGNSTVEVADVGRAASANRGRYLPPKEVERKEKFLGSVEPECDDQPPGVSNQSKHVVHHVLAGKTFCSEMDLGEKGQTNSGNKIETGFKARGGGTYTSSTAAAQNCDSAQLPATRKKKINDGWTEPRNSRWDERTANPDPTSESSISYNKCELDTNIYWERTEPPKTRERPEQPDIIANSTLNWTIIMKHTRRKYESSSTNSYDF